MYFWTLLWSLFILIFIQLWSLFILIFILMILIHFDLIKFVMILIHFYLYSAWHDPNSFWSLISSSWSSVFILIFIHFVVTHIHFDLYSVRYDPWSFWSLFCLLWSLFILIFIQFVMILIHFDLDSVCHDTYSVWPLLSFILSAQPEVKIRYYSALKLSLSTCCVRKDCDVCIYVCEREREREGGYIRNWCGFLYCSTHKHRHTCKEKDKTK